MNYLSVAHGIAQRNRTHGYSVGAVLVDRRGNILAQGQNHFCHTHFCGRLARGQRSCHAEWHVLRKVKGQAPKRSVIYVFVLTPQKNPGFSRPCEICWKNLKKAGVQRVIYSDRGQQCEERIS